MAGIVRSAFLEFKLQKIEQSVTWKRKNMHSFFFSNFVLRSFVLLWFSKNLDVVCVLKIAIVSYVRFIFFNLFTIRTSILGIYIPIWIFLADVSDSVA